MIGPSEIVHATAVAKDGRAVLISGPSGAGKSDLALRLIDRGFRLVSDDRTSLRVDGDRLLAAPPATIAGKLEVRGIGIVEMDYATDLAVSLVVELGTEVPRFPDDDQARTILGLPVPLIFVDAFSASAAAKVAIALERLGIDGR